MTDLQPVDRDAIAAAAARLDRELTADASREDRLACYARLRAEVAVDLPADPADAFTRRLAVEYAIRDIERRFEVGADSNATSSVWDMVDPTSPEYALSQTPRLREPVRRLFEVTEREGSRRSTGVFYRMRVMLSLWLRAINHEASQDRIGYIWLILDPLIHVMIICFVSLFIHPRNIYDMPSYPFGVVGACFWLTFRTAVTGTMFGGGVLRPQLEHPVIRRFDIMMARALNAPIVYIGVGAFLMGLAMWLNLTTWPVNLPGFMACFLTVWLMGLFYGTLVNSLILHYPGFRRVNGFVIRLIAIMSGLFYVSEQLPEPMRGLMLLNPLIHIVQLARTCWFATYHTRDADPLYVLFWFLALGLLALTCLTLDEKRPETVRA
ncbi:MAG: hypothetical protein RIS94_303 [Pseudomonadota bacterium]|jgi:ABC-type polysaccharide/polyol phosphate export permease